MRVKKFLFVLICIMLFGVFTDVEATCYEKCVYPMPVGGSCEYVENCTSSGSISCTIVSDSLCGITNYDNYDPDAITSCGDGYVDQIPTLLPKVISTIYTIIQIVVPIILVVMGSIDLVKGMTAQKEDEIKKGQKMLVKRLIYGAVIFFIFIAVKLVISLVADSSSNKILDCAECFINNNCD